MPALQAAQSGLQNWYVVVVDVTVDTDVRPVASHLVMGSPQIVVHVSPSARLFGPPKVVVAVAVHVMLQLLTVCEVQDYED
jgi:hypothetical protein